MLWNPVSQEHLAKVEEVEVRESWWSCGECGRMILYFFKSRFQNRVSDPHMRLDRSRSPETSKESADEIMTWFGKPLNSPQSKETVEERYH